MVELILLKTKGEIRRRTEWSLLRKLGIVRLDTTADNFGALLFELPTLSASIFYLD